MRSWPKRIGAEYWYNVRGWFARLRGRDEYDASLDADDPMLWSRDIGQHAVGEYSFAVVQANETLEDHSQVETGRDATFFGVYDGHGGPDAARFVASHLFDHLINFVGRSGEFSEGIVRNAFYATERGFLERADRVRRLEPSIDITGSCCLMGIIWRGTLYVGNLGDSRAVIGSVGNFNNIVSEQLSVEHNVNRSEVRRQLKIDHHDDPNIVLKVEGFWRIKGITQVSRCFGDAYLKIPALGVNANLLLYYGLPQPLRRPIVSANPTVMSRALRPQDRFLIFASDGLWEWLSNKRAVEIVHKHPRPGIARRLVRTAMEESARKYKMKYVDIKQMVRGRRRNIHDDITVIVIFIDHGLLLQPSGSVEEVSLRGFVDATGPSNFTRLGASA